MYLQPAGVNISMKILVLGKAGFWEMQGVMLEAFGACGNAAAPDRQCCSGAVPALSKVSSHPAPHCCPSGWASCIMVWHQS